MTQYVGLDVSLKETKHHVLDEAGNRIWRGRCATDAAAIAAAVRRYAPTAVRIGLETGPLTTWLWTTLRLKVCRWSVSMRVMPRRRSI
jgi:transposase